MVKLGVWKPAYFFAAPPDSWWLYAYYRLSRSRVSLRLLRDSTQGSVDVAFSERLMRHVRLSNGVARTTFERRFHDLDSTVNCVLSQHFSSGDQLLIEDWAASACLTSCQWAESLFSLFPQMRFVASDLALFLIEIEHRTSKEIFVAEENGTPLQYVRPPFVIRMSPPEPWVLPINRFWYEWARYRWRNVRRAWPVSMAWLCANGARQDEQHMGYWFRKLPVIHPRALALGRTDSRFAIRRHSVFDRAETACSVIRTMNILNRAYFSEQELTAASRNVLASLRPGGIWIVGRTASDTPPVHNVSLFQKQDSGVLKLIRRIGAGSEIDALALAATELDFSN